MKWVKRIAAAVVLLVIVAGIIVFIYLGSIVRSVIQEQATASLNVPTTLASASLSLFGGSVSLSDLEVGSPPTYSAPHTVTLGGCSVAVHYGELTGNPIHVSHITIDDPVLFVEQSNLKLNLQALMDQMPQTPKSSSGQVKEPMKLIIDELDVSNAQVNFLPGLPGLQAQIPVTIPSMNLKNIGNADGNGNGAAIKDVVLQVITALAAKAGSIAKLPPELTALLNTDLGGLSAQLGGNFSKQVQGLGGTIGNVLNGGGGAATQAVNGVGNGVGNAINGINGLFGGKKGN